MYIAIVVADDYTRLTRPIAQNYSRAGLLGHKLGYKL